MSALAFKMSNDGKRYFEDNDIRLLQTGKLADSTVKCQGRIWKVHRLLLASRLDFFQAAFFDSSLVRNYLKNRTTLDTR